MTKVYQVVEKDLKDECYLLCGEVPRSPGFFAASVIYWIRAEELPEQALKTFPSAISAEDAKAQAEGWIKKNLFEDYHEYLLREE